jgi:hypothetical protein
MRLVSIPATLVGIAIAIIFFKIYGLFTRPAVPAPVAFVVSKFAPGVEIGAKVSDAKRAVAAMTYVPHLGFVGLPGGTGVNLPGAGYASFVQVRLLLDEATRINPHPDPAKSRIDAVEIVSADALAYNDISEALVMLFRRAPRDGCIRTGAEDKFREVHFWTTPNERGGVALITDFKPNPRERTPGPMLTNVIAFTGNFDGGRTLRANYTDMQCTQLAGAQ